MPYQVNSITEDNEHDCYLLELELDESPFLEANGVTRNLAEKYEVGLSIGRPRIQEIMTTYGMDERESIIKVVDELWDGTWSQPPPPPLGQDQIIPRDYLLP